MPLTERDNLYVSFFVQFGDKYVAAEKAGFSTTNLPATVHKLMSSRHIRAAIAKAQQDFLNQELVPAANGALLTILKDGNASPSARVSAARLAYEAGGLLVKDREGQNDKPAHEMSAAELGAEIQRLEQELVGKQPRATLERIEGSSTTMDDLLA